MRHRAANGSIVSPCKGGVEGARPLRLSIRVCVPFETQNSSIEHRHAICCENLLDHKVYSMHSVVHMEGTCL